MYLLIPKINLNRPFYRISPGRNLRGFKKMKVGDISQNTSKEEGNFYVNPLLSGSIYYFQKRGIYRLYN